MAPKDDPLHGLIGRLYDAAMDEGLWSGLADDIATTFGATSAVLKIDHASGSQVDILELTSNFEVTQRDPAWAEHWHRHDLWVQQSRRLGANRVITSQDLMPRAQLENTGFYRDWLRPLDIHSMVGAVFTLENDALGVIGVHRPASHSGDFDEHDRRRLGMLLPHLQRAFQLRQRLQKQHLERAAASLWLDRTAVAVFVVSAKGRLVHANGRAEQLLRQQTALLVADGRLTTGPAGPAADMARQIAAAAHSAAGRAQRPGNALLIPRPGEAPLTLLIAPLSASMAASARLPQQPLVALFAHDPEELDLSPRTLQALFGLTPTEARIAAALALGYSLEEASEAQDIGIGTARTHLKSAMAKTGTHRQAEMVSLLLRSVAPWSRMAESGGSADISKR